MDDLIAAIRSASASEMLTVSRSVRFATMCGMISSTAGMHEDDEAARRLGLPAAISFGLLTSAIAARTLTDAAGPGSVSRIRARFLLPVWVGETVTASLSPRRVRVVDGVHLVDVDCVVRTSSGDVCLAGDALVATPGAPVDAGERSLGLTDGRDVPAHDVHRSRVVVERGPAVNFADAIGDHHPAHRDLSAARAIGLDGVPLVPSFGFAAILEHWGRFPEEQPAGHPDTPMMAAHARLEELVGPGLVMHAAQEFDYARPLWVGDRLDGSGRIVDTYRRAGKTGELTFVVCENEWRDRRGDRVMCSRETFVAPRA